MTGTTGQEGAGRPGPRRALALLLAGNQRFASGQAEHPRQSVARRAELAGHQDPFALVVSCIDSRVPPEVVFDCGLGDLFVVRTGAQAIDDQVVLGSIEFGPLTFSATRLIVVLGHSGCGAVTAAISVLRDGATAPGRIGAVVDALRPAYQAVTGQRGDLAANMIAAQTRLTAHRLSQDPVLRDLAFSDGLVVVGAHYDLGTGLVTVQS